MTESNKLAKSLFGASEVKNRIAASAVKLIMGDIKVLYDEFKDAKGAGALFFNPTAPEKSAYLTADEIQNDMSLSQELMNTSLTEFLQKLLNIVDRNSGENGLPVVVMIADDQMTIHLLDLEKMDESIERIIDSAAS